MNPHILTTIFNMSIEASILVCVICIFRFIFRKAPKWITCALWGIAGLKLVIPFSFDSIVGILPSKSAVELNSNGTSLSFSSQSVQHIVDGVIAPAVADTVAGTNVSVSSEQLFIGFMCKIWTAGFFIMVLYAVVSYIRVFIKVRESIKSDKVYLCDKIGTPFILGFFKPKIYVPSGIDGSSLGAILAHETAHIRRMDHWWKPIGYLILSVYWFNPLLWTAYILLCRDIEFACDEKVIANMSAEDIADYSQALLNVSLPVRIVTACPVAFGEIGVKQRIKSVLNYKKPSFWIIIAAVIAAVSLTLVFATNRKENVEPDVLTADESTVYLDEESESEYGYYHCYYSPDLTGSSGIAKKNAKGDISVVIKPDYDLVLVISQNRFIAQRGSYFALLDSDENEIIPFFRGVIRQINGRTGEKVEPILSVEPLDGTDYFTDSDGNKIIDQEFLSTGFTEDGLFFGVTQDAYIFFDITGKTLCTVRDGETAVLSPLEHGYSRLVKKEGTRFRYGVQAPDGSVLVPCEYDQVEMPFRDRIVARIGDWYGLDASDIARIFDETGRQLTKDGDYSSITFSDDSGYGIASKFNIDSTAPDGYTVATWVVNKDGKIVSDANGITEFTREVAEETTKAAVIINDGYTKTSIKNKATAKAQSINTQGKSLYIIDSITADYDNDGVKETIQVLSGPTSGLYTLAVKVIDGKNEYSEVFMPENQQGFDNIRLTEKDGKVYFNADAGGKTVTYQVTVNHNVVSLKNGSEEMSYWGGKIKYYVTDNSGREIEISNDDSLEIYSLMKSSKTQESTGGFKGNIKMRFDNQNMMYDSDSGKILGSYGRFEYTFPEQNRKKLNKILSKYTDIES